MLLLNSLNIKEEQANILAKKKFISAENYLRVPPKTIHLYKTVVALDETQADKDVCIAGTLQSVKGQMSASGRYIVIAKVKDFATGKLLTVNFLGQFQMLKEIQKWGQNKTVICGGKLQYSKEYHSFSMLNPYVFTKEVLEGMTNIADYGTMKHFERNEILELHKKCLAHKYNEFIPTFLLNKYEVVDVNTCLQDLHTKDKSTQEYKKAEERLKFEHLFYFALKMEQQLRDMPRTSDKSINNDELVKGFINQLPYELTKDQKKIYDDIKKKVENKERVNALVQGDVGSGKTSVAFLAMFLMASNGYQSILMAPTCVLAKQHYEELKGYADKLGIHVAFIGGKQTAKEKKEIIKGIKDGFYQMIVGTHGVLSNNVTYHNIGLIITDEEHRFGVLQRNKVTERINARAIHTITMSATPIPRTIAQSLYGEMMEVYTIKTKPSGRQPIDTTIYNNQTGIFKFMEMEIAKGHQAYVICPLIENDEENESMKNLNSVKKTYELYQAYFKNKSISVEYITGKMSEAETNKKLESFANNETKILIATTIVEVGVNVPNATVICINNAERFGMASLHQLRGRVGRGNDKSYCILNSDCTQKGDLVASNRLQGICDTNDGYEIALYDLRNRGVGELFGEKQSGKNIYIELMLENRNLYEQLREDAKKICEMETENNFIAEYEEIYNINMEE